MKLQAPNLEDCQQVRLWRNECLETLRTPYPLTEEQQADFYRNVICNRNSPHRYWSIIEATEKFKNDLIGFGGLTYIENTNGKSEISLIINPKHRGKEYGIASVDLLLLQAFHYLRLYSIYGEVYQTNEIGIKFWEKVVNKYGGYMTELPDRKYWLRQWYSSMYFSINAEQYNANKTM